MAKKRVVKVDVVGMSGKIDAAEFWYVQDEGQVMVALLYVSGADVIVEVEDVAREFVDRALDADLDCGNDREVLLPLSKVDEARAVAGHLARHIALVSERVWRDKRSARVQDLSEEDLGFGHEDGKII